MTQFTTEEVQAIKIMVRDLANRCQEDTIGAILKTGAFHPFPDTGVDSAVVRLAEKLEMSKEEKERFQF